MLPRGFQDIFDVRSEAFFKTIEKFVSRARLFGCDPLNISPLQYLDVTSQGREISEDIIYSFKDKSERNLVLTPDSTPAVLRWVCEQDLSMQRICFISPIFRYRRQKRRFFHQIGFAISGEPQTIKYPDLDPNVLILAQQASQLFHFDFNLQMKMQVTDFRLWHNLLSKLQLSQQQIHQWLHEIRFLDYENRLIKLEQLNGDQDVKDTLRELLQPGKIDICHVTQKTKEYLTASLNFAKAAVKGTSIPVELHPSDFHSSELQEEMAFSFVDPRGKRMADGGDYSYYARSFDKKLNSFYSFATGVEFLSDFLPSYPVKRPKIIILAKDINPIEASFISEPLNQMGVICFSRSSKKNMATDIRQEIKRGNWVIPFGVREKESMTIQVKGRGSDDLKLSIESFLHEIKALAISHKINPSLHF